MLRNDFYLLVKLVLMCLALFLFFDAVSVLLASVLVYFKIKVFSFNYRDIFISFFRSGYIGGIILGIGLWIKAKLQERKDKKKLAK